MPQHLPRGGIDGTQVAAIDPRVMIKEWVLLATDRYLLSSKVWLVSTKRLIVLLISRNRGRGVACMHMQNFSFGGFVKSHHRT
jgi:hypothetical protein